MSPSSLADKLKPSLGEPVNGEATGDLNRTSDGHKDVIVHNHQSCTEYFVKHQCVEMWNISTLLKKKKVRWLTEVVLPLSQTASIWFPFDSGVLRKRSIQTFSDHLPILPGTNKNLELSKIKRPCSNDFVRILESAHSSKVSRVPSPKRRAPRPHPKTFWHSGMEQFWMIDDHVLSFDTHLRESWCISWNAYLLLPPASYFFYLMPDHSSTGLTVDMQNPAPIDLLSNPCHESCLCFHLNLNWWIWWSVYHTKEL